MARGLEQNPSSGVRIRVPQGLHALVRRRRLFALMEEFARRPPEGFIICFAPDLQARLARSETGRDS